MVKPENVPFYNLNDYELQEFLVFCVLVAQKSAYYIAKSQVFLMDLLSPKTDTPTPQFSIIGETSLENLIIAMKRSGIGCYNAKSRALKELAGSGLDLRTCSIEDLERIKGIGPKTSRFFVLHTRRDAKCAILDVHILRHMRNYGHTFVPLSTPQNRKTYARLEKLFIQMVPSGMTIAEYDAMLWTKYRVNPGRYFENI